MSLLLAVPEALVAAASDVAGIGSTLSMANAAAAAPTTGVLAAAADEVSTQVAALFSQHAQGYQQLSARAAAFHDQFVLALNSAASQYAAAEANAVHNLVNAVNSPAEKLLIGRGATTGQNIVSNAIGRVQSIFGGTGASSALGGSAASASQAAASALALRPTGGASALAAASAAAAPGTIGNAIQNAYLAIEPWVQYGFNLAAYAVGYLPYVGLLAPQIYFFYDLFEPIVQSGLFNTLDWLGGTIAFSQGLSNFWEATTASINSFIQTEINWVLGFLPPLPPLPPFP
jgi:PE family